MSIFNPLEKFGLSGVISAFSRRQDGNMSLCFGDIADSLNNRKKFLLEAGIDYKKLICAKQMHGNNIQVVIQAHAGSGVAEYESSIADTDGFVTDQKNLAIAIFTADCLSIFIYDPKRPAIAVLHAGWRSTEKNIAQAGVNRMQRELGSQPEDLLVGFGPAIRACCFEVEKDFKSNFAFGLINRGGRVYMDIALINRRQLMDCGVQDKNIFDPALCTFSDPDFFSFRKEAQLAGRMISVCMLK